MFILSLLAFTYHDLSAWNVFHPVWLTPFTLKDKTHVQDCGKIFHMHVYHQRLFTSFLVSSKYFIYVSILGLMMVNHLYSQCFLHAHFHYEAVECLRFEEHILHSFEFLSSGSRCLALGNSTYALHTSPKQISDLVSAYDAFFLIWAPQFRFRSFKSQP